MKKITINPLFVKNAWVIIGATLLLTMSLLFQGLFGPIKYFNQYQLPGYPFVFGEYFPFTLSIIFFLWAYQQSGKEFIFYAFCGLIMLIIGIIFILTNLKTDELRIAFSFIFSFLPLAFFIYASLNVHRKYFSSIFLGLVTLCAGLEAYWTTCNWHYGVKFQGLDFIHHSIVKNIICFLSIYILMGIYYKSRNTIFFHAAILLFCVTISIVAFPWLGESM